MHEIIVKEFLNNVVMSLRNGAPILVNNLSIFKPSPLWVRQRGSVKKRSGDSHSLIQSHTKQNLTSTA